MKKLGQLHFDLLSLEHVILRLLADGGDLVKLPRHRVRFLQNTVKNYRASEQDWWTCSRWLKMCFRTSAISKTSDNIREVREEEWAWRDRMKLQWLTIISMGLQRDVPQYIAIPWLITWVIARTVSANHHNRLNQIHTTSPISHGSFHPRRKMPKRNEIDFFPLPCNKHSLTLMMYSIDCTEMSL